MLADPILSPQFGGQPHLRLGYSRSGNFSRVRHVQEGARRYAEAQGLSHSVKGLAQTQAVPRTGFAIQQAYREAQASPTEHPDIRQSYEHMRRETQAQYEHMTKPSEQGGMGMRVEVTPHDPYRSAAEMANDVRRNRRIRVLSTAATGGHEFFTNEENDRFRAVHDVFGHAATGRGFTRHGEEAAWRSHVQMYSPGARQAMTSETRGQNSYLNYAPQGGFPDQGPGSNLVGLPKFAERRRGLPAPQPSPVGPNSKQLRMM